VGGTSRLNRKDEWIMKKIYYIFLTTIILSVSPQTALTADKTIPAGQPASTGVLNPALIGIKAIRVTVFPPNAVIGTDDILSANMKAAVERRLAESDPRLAALLQQGFNPTLLDPPLMRINIDKFSLTSERPPVFSVRTTLSANVSFVSNTATLLKVDVWSRADTIQAPNINAEVAAVNSLISKHIEEFVKDFSLANAAPVLPADVNNVKIMPPQKPQISTQTSDKPKAEVKPQPPPTDTKIQYGYVASKDRKIFHKPDCTSVKSILPQNLVYYKTRDEAIAAGKRPCQICKP
jgi:hypothetical protein